MPETMVRALMSSAGVLVSNHCLAEPQVNTDIANSNDPRGKDKQNRSSKLSSAVISSAYKLYNKCEIQSKESMFHDIVSLISNFLYICYKILDSL